MRPRATSKSTETSMLAFLEGGVQQERVVRVAWPERVSLGRPAVGKGLGPWRVWPLWRRPGQDPHLISWAGLSAFWVLKMSVSCSSRCLSCSHVESLLQMKDSGHSLNTLWRRGEGWTSGSLGFFCPPGREGRLSHGRYPSTCREEGPWSPQIPVATLLNSAGQGHGGRTQVGSPAGVAVTHDHQLGTQGADSRH